MHPKCLYPPHKNAWCHNPQNIHLKCHCHGNLLIRTTPVPLPSAKRCHVSLVAPRTHCIKSLPHSFIVHVCPVVSHTVVIRITQVEHKWCKCLLCYKGDKTFYVFECNENDLFFLCTFSYIIWYYF
jgi:hypothetical protein